MGKSGIVVGGTVLIVAFSAAYLWQRQGPEAEATAESAEAESQPLPMPPAAAAGTAQNLQSSPTQPAAQESTANNLRQSPPPPTGSNIQPAVVRQASTAGSSEGGVTPEGIVSSNDQNGDGVVTREEAEASGRSLHQMWDNYDLNKDGKVDSAEIEQFNAIIAAMPETKPPGSSIVASNDKDGDGIVTRAEAAQTNKALHRRWDTYDLNKDGKVDAAEIEKASGR